MFADGTGVPRVSVDVIRADDRQSDGLTARRSGSSDESGRFSVDAVLPGRYVVAINASGPKLMSPYATAYFPGVAQKSASALIDMGDGERKSGFTFVVSPLVETTVSGMVQFDDGRPVEGATVRAAPVNHRGNVLAAVRTDNNGAFQLRVLAGVAYTIRVATRTASGVRQAEAVVFVDGQTDDLRMSILP